MSLYGFNRVFAALVARFGKDGAVQIAKGAIKSASEAHGNSYGYSQIRKVIEGKR